MTPASKPLSSDPKRLTSSPSNAQDLIKIQQTIIPQIDQRIKDLEAESAESKLEVTSLTLENDSLTGVDGRDGDAD